MIATPKATAASVTLGLLSLVGHGHGYASNDCDSSAGICLTTFRWCNPDSCQYPKNVKLLSESRPDAYGMLRCDETYYVNWTTPSPKDEVVLTWYILRPSNHLYSVDTTENYVKFYPDDVIKEIVESERYNVAESDTRVMVTDIGNHIFTLHGKETLLTWRTQAAQQPNRPNSVSRTGGREE
ncbi:hypothetical protein B0T11DRAFT_356132 [Plectosphaerella cucumerina]|uniref:Uncharacterized protein n=1 Tax=Plectosphaerella cucumerina TaxID=40658 RepID=A0A8K0TEJ9_9PEZI|nr:hypothetical protein B0T11DRAFT_356132 [Plectosphaerella cucumerina]